MIFELPFDIYFHPDYDSEVLITNWEKGEAEGLVYCKASLESLNLSVTGTEKDGWNIKIHNGGKKAYTGFFEVRFSWRRAIDCFTFIPGIYYDGNEMEELHNIPFLRMPEKPEFSASFSACSFPAVMFKDGNTGYSYKVSAKSIARWNGVGLNAQSGALSIFAPAMEKRVYRFQEFDDSPRPPHTLQVRSVLSVHIKRESFECQTVSDLFRRYFDFTLYPEAEISHNSPKIPEKDAAEIIRDWMFEKHCVYTEEKIPLILNAFTDIGGKWPYEGSMAEWNTMIGWCSGSMTAFPLLKYGGKYRDFAVDYLDFLSTHGNSACGVKYPVFDGSRWMTKDHPEADMRNYDHCRFYCDYIHYLGKAIRFEKEEGFIHKAWEDDFARGIEILRDIWKREKDFGIYWDITGKTVDVYRKGTGGGAFALLALYEGTLHFPFDAELKNIFSEACEAYYERCVLTGRCNGGPADIKEADDSESIAALTDALVKNHKLYKNDKTLKMALNAAALFASWVVCYSPCFPGGSRFESTNICGGVLANVQNRHIGPGICTNSARFLYDLGELSGNRHFTDLYYNIKAAAINCITSYDGEFYGLSPDSPFKKGMMSEQINMSDALGIEGETWRVSTCWPSTAVLLGYFETP